LNDQVFFRAFLFIDKGDCYVKNYKITKLGISALFKIVGKTPTTTIEGNSVSWNIPYESQTELEEIEKIISNYFKDVSVPVQSYDNAQAELRAKMNALKRASRGA